MQKTPHAHPRYMLRQATYTTTHRITDISQAQRVLSRLSIPTDPLPARQVLVGLIVVLVSVRHLVLCLILDVEQCLSVRIADGTQYGADGIEAVREDLSERITDEGEGTYYENALEIGWRVGAGMVDLSGLTTPWWLCNNKLTRVVQSKSLLLVTCSRAMCLFHRSCLLSGRDSPSEFEQRRRSNKRKEEVRILAILPTHKHDHGRSTNYV